MQTDSGAAREVGVHQADKGDVGPPRGAGHRPGAAISEDDDTAARGTSRTKEVAPRIILPHPSDDRQVTVLITMSCEGGDFPRIGAGRIESTDAEAGATDGTGGAEAPLKTLATGRAEITTTGGVRRPRVGAKTRKEDPR